MLDISLLSDAHITAQKSNLLNFFSFNLLLHFCLHANSLINVILKRGNYNSRKTHLICKVSLITDCIVHYDVICNVCNIPSPVSRKYIIILCNIGNEIFFKVIEKNVAVFCYDFSVLQYLCSYL